MNSSLGKKPLWPFILLLFFYFLWSANLVRFTLQSVDYNPQSDLGLFHSESAFQYRYARLAAQGKPIPDFDLAAQWPEGLKTRQVIHTLMDRVAGELYRRLIPKTIPFHLYIIYFVAYFSTLTVFPLFFLICKLSKKPMLALPASAAYAMTFATYGRSLGGYLHENFALPFLFLFLGCFYTATAHPWAGDDYPAWKRRLWLLLAGTSLLVALASWHLSQFFFTALTLSLLPAVLWQRQILKDKAGAHRLMQGFFYLLPFLILAGLFFPTLRYQGFLLSPTMIFALSLGGIWVIWRVKSRLKFALGGLVLLGAGAAFFFSSLHWGEYAHVYDLLYYKLRFFGQKPADPSLLNYEARVFWTAGFDTPTLKDLALHYNLLLPLGLGGLFLSLAREWKNKEASALRGLYMLTILFLFLSLLLLRMGVFLTFLLALFVPYWWGKAGAPNLTLAEGRQRNILKWVAGLSLAALLGFQLFFAATFKFYKQPRQEDFLLQEVIRHTSPGDPFLTPFELGSSILTYTGRPVVLHSMFEEKEIRAKNQSFLEALYGTEEELYHYCRQVGARYLLYQCFLLLDTSTNSNRYVAAKMKLIPQSAAFRLHFQEKDLKHFRLVFQDGPFRLFKVKGTRNAENQETLSLYSPFFNPLIFDLKAGASEIEPAQFQSGLRKIDEFQGQVKLAGDFIRNKIYNKALVNLNLAEQLDPQSPLPPYLRAYLYLEQNQKEEAKAELKKSLGKNPQYIYAQELLRKLP